MSQLLRVLRMQLAPTVGLAVWLPFMVAICMQSMRGPAVLFAIGAVGIAASGLAQCCVRWGLTDRARSHGGQS